MPTSLSEPTLDNPTLAGPVKIRVLEMTVSATLKQLPQACDQIVRLAPSATGSLLSMPAVAPVHVPGPTAINPSTAANIPRKDDVYVIWNTHATNTVQLRQPDGTTNLGSPFAAGAVWVRCRNPNSDTAGYEIIPMI